MSNPQRARIASRLHGEQRDRTADCSARTLPSAPELKAATRAEEIGATAVQVFTDNPTAWRRRPQPPQALAEFRARLAALGSIHIAVHAPYLDQPVRRQRRFLGEVDRDGGQRADGRSACSARGSWSCTSARIVGFERDEGIERLALGLRAVLAEADAANAGQRDRMPMLVLENAAGHGRRHRRVDRGPGRHLGRGGSRPAWPMDRIGICLDTAHLWGAGYRHRDRGRHRRSRGPDRRDDRPRQAWSCSISTIRARRSVRDSTGTSTSGPARSARAGHAQAAAPPLAGDPADVSRDAGHGLGYDKVNLDRARMLIDGADAAAAAAGGVRRCAVHVPGVHLRAPDPVVRRGPYQGPISSKASRTGYAAVAQQGGRVTRGNHSHPVSGEYQDPMSVQNGRAFNEWLRTQLKAKKMSQRQLAQQSGVDHSTISRLVRGDRTPSLGTATKLARGLRELRDETETPALLRARRARRPATQRRASSTRCAPTIC